MKFLEKWKEDNPNFKEEEVEKLIRYKCPDEYGYENNSNCDYIEHGEGESKCKNCWNREMPDVERDGIQSIKVNNTSVTVELEKKIEEIEEIGYNKGLTDAWSLARKIVDLDYSERGKVFGNQIKSPIDALKCVDVNEAIAKLKEYEDSKIEVGDVIKLPSGNGVVTNIDGENIVFMTKSGEFAMLVGSVPKTGKHLEIKAILEQIGE